MNHNYEKLEVYVRSKDLAKEILKYFISDKHYRLADQICSSALSIPSNISEGAERGTNKSFKLFLEYSSGSAAELHTQLSIIKDLEEFKNLPIEELLAETREIRRMLRGLLKSIS